MGKLTIQEIAKVLVERSGLSQKDANRFASEMFAIIQQRLEEDELVKIKGLGTFKIINVEARESVSVRTGERVVIDSHAKVTFTPDAVMKELVNKPFSQFETVVLNDGVEFDDVTEDSDEDNAKSEEKAVVTEEESSAEEVPSGEESIVEEQSIVMLADVEPISEEPVVEEPVVEEPVVEEPVVEEPAVEEPVVEEPVVEEPVVEEPVVEEPAAEEPVIEKIVSDDLGFEEPSFDALPVSMLDAAPTRIFDPKADEPDDDIPMIPEPKPSFEKAEPEAAEQSVCPKCGTALPPDCAFCIECGAPIASRRNEQHEIYSDSTTRFCTECDMRITDPEAVFCNNCGNRLDSSAGGKAVEPTPSAPSEKRCPFCGFTTSDPEMMFCIECGSKLM